MTFMALTNYKVQNKKAFGIFAVVVIAAMFLIRYILLESGTIDAMYTLDEEELYSALTAYEVGVEVSGSADRSDTDSDADMDAETSAATSETASEDEESLRESDSAEAVGGGTILDARKNSTSDEEYTLTIVASLDVTGTTAQERGITVTLPDGSGSAASVIAFNESAGYALIQCLCPDELEVYYSVDILYRLAAEEPVYVLDAGAVIGGTVTETDTDLEDVGEGLIEASLDSSVSDAVIGAGLYGKSGNYLGMIVASDGNGTIWAVPGDVIMSALDAAL